MAGPDDQPGGTAATVAPAAAGARLTTQRPAPFVGAAPYEEDDAPFFFGRADEVDALLAAARSSGLTVLYGPSGAGKTSALFAGVVHRLREEAREAHDAGPLAIGIVRAWDGDPHRQVEAAAREALDRLPGDEPLPARKGTLAETLGAWTEQRGPLLLVLDQFEQHILRHPDLDDGSLTGFSAELVRVVRARNARVRVLVAVGEDAWSGLARFDGQIPPALVEYVRLDELPRDAAREAIDGAVFAWDRLLPAGVDPYFVEGALAEEVISLAEGGGGAVETAILQVLLARLWRATVEDDAKALTVARLQALGPRRIVEQHVAAVLRRLSRREQTTVAACFRYLVTDATIRIPQRAADLADWTRRPASQVESLLERLCTRDGGWLLRPVADDYGRRYELSHDILAAPIAAWRGEHDRERRQITRRRVTRIGAAAIVAAAVAALAGTLIAANLSSTSRKYHAAQRNERRLNAQILQLTAARRAEAAQAAEVRQIERQNDAVRTQTSALEDARNRLDAKIASLRTDNHKLVVTIRRFNGWNAALAKKINAVDKTYDSLAGTLADLRTQRVVLQNAAGTLGDEATAQAAQLAALTAQNANLARKASTFGYVAPSTVAPTPAAPAKVKPSQPVTAPTFPVAADVSGRDPIRHRVAVLDLNLTALVRSARPAARMPLVRQEHALLVQQKDALTRENAQLEATRAALAARHSTLQRTRDQASAEHKSLEEQLATRSARNTKRTNEISSLQSTNAGLQSKATKAITALAATQRKIAAARSENTNLISVLDARVAKLTEAAAGAGDPQLSGLLALEAYRLTPYEPDDGAHPEVYNALWLALKKLDDATATKLIETVGKATGKVGTSATLAKALCTHISRPLSAAEWQTYLAGAPYSASAANPCSS